MFKVCRRNFKLYKPYLLHGNHVYQYGYKNPAEVNYFILVGSTIITEHYIKDVWMINVHAIKRL